jgi:2-keto-4-pentenoate hydratase/2-oxohepta-3-ene-1,7-dioic acid hydratase in catechol pathway
MHWFGLATYEKNLKRHTAWVNGEKLYDLNELSKASPSKVPAPLLHSIEETLASWSELQLEDLAMNVSKLIQNGNVEALEPNSFKLCCPYEPRRIFAAASNYYEHAQEMGTKLIERSESSPFVFMKAETCITGPNSPVIKPSSVQKLDWEVELGVVIGTGGRHIGVEQALKHVAGYVVFNDISSRDLTRRTDYPFSHDWFRGKSFETFAPMGPWLVPRDCLGSPNNFRLILDVNGVRMQDGNTKDMIFDTAEQIAYLSRMTTLKPGDLIATGTPTGVGMGRGIFLQPGDVMKASIEGIGYIKNQVEAEIEH